VGTGATNLGRLVGALHGGSVLGSGVWWGRLIAGLTAVREGCSCSLPGWLAGGLAGAFSGSARASPSNISFLVSALEHCPETPTEIVGRRVGETHDYSKKSQRSQTLATAVHRRSGSGRGLTADENVWITAFRWSRGVPESAAEKRRYPQ
jgi:hypothetical protein